MTLTHLQRLEAESIAILREDSAYEAPTDPEVHIRTVDVDADRAAAQIVEHLYRSGLRA